MEHIPKPQYSNGLRFDIPYLCGDGYKYDRKSSFTEYGPQLGWTSNTEEPYCRGSLRDAAVILQKWLFFGLVSEFFRAAGIDVDTEDFVRRDENGNFISTHLLNQFLLQWVEGIKNLDWPSRTVAADTVDKIVTVAHVTTNYLGEQEEVTFSKVVLSVLAIGAILTYVRRNVFKSGGLCPIPGWNEVCPYRQWAKSKYLIHLMKSSGWCFSEIARLYSSSFSVMGVVFAVHLKRPQKDLRHVSCTETTCTALQVNEETYKTVHVRDGCDCQHLGPDPSHTCSILHRGGIPIIRISNRGIQSLFGSRP